MNSTTPTKYAPFPIARAALTLTAVALAAGLIEKLLTAAVPGWSVAWREVPFAVAVAWLAAVLGIVPVALMGPYGVTATITAYFAGTGARVLICVAAMVLGVYGLRLAMQPLLLSLAATYLALLPVEVALVGQYLKRQDHAGAVDSGKPREVVS